MKTLLVTNKGRRTRYRLGVGFEPDKETEIKVLNNRQYLTIKAVKDFVVKEKKDNKTKAKEEQNQEEKSGQSTEK